MTVILLFLKFVLNHKSVCSVYRNLDLTSCAGSRHNMPRPCKLTFDLLTLKVVSESRVTWATSVPIVFWASLYSSRLRPDVHDRQIYVRQTDVRRASSLNVPYLGAGHNKIIPRA